MFQTLKRQLLEEAGRTVGFRGGKAQRAWELRQALDKKKARLELLYDFRTLISAQGWLPPVIDEAVDVAAYHSQPDPYGQPGVRKDFPGAIRK